MLTVVYLQVKNLKGRTPNSKSKSKK